MILNSSLKKNENFVLNPYGFQSSDSDNTLFHSMTIGNKFRKLFFKIPKMIVSNELKLCT